MTTKQLTDNDIIHYLNHNKDFFVRHPEQLDAIEVDNKGKVASLINHQVNVLKQRNNQLKGKLLELIHHAQENEKIMGQVFELSLQLCQISHIANVTKHFGRFVKNSFDCDLFKMVLPEYENLESSASVLCLDEEKVAQFDTLFAEFKKNSQPICGRLRKEKLAFIFGQRAQDIGSCVILPIGQHSAKGLLVFASFDDARFNPDMSTDLLAKLSHILDKKLSKTFRQQQEQQDNKNEPD